MKHYITICVCLMALSVQAQKKKMIKPTTINRSSRSYALKTQEDSISYAIGMAVAKSYSNQGIKNINALILSRGVQDVLAKKPTLLLEVQSEVAILNVTNPAAAKRVQEGARFLAKNSAKPGVKVTSSGLQYEVINESEGIKPLATDTVEVNYKGTLIDGSEFDSSYKYPDVTKFPLNQVIKGWTEGLQLMAEGSKYKFYIPHRLAYGTMDRGPQIPGGSVLIFEIELLKIKKSSK